MLSDLSLTAIPEEPGVYRFLDANQEVLYVGKAKHLKKRVRSYFQANHPSPKVVVMMRQVAHVECTVTATENEALLLECNLIKALKPKYNILLRDDKSYPYIQLIMHPLYPTLALYRGAKQRGGRYFGPYTSAHAAKKALYFLQKLFKIRSCNDSFFANRSRPCLQYQINRCSAPCVGYIDAKPYQEAIQHAVLFLEGKSQTVIDDLIKKMDDASERLEFEQAAKWRDEIQLLRQIQESQSISADRGVLDVIALARRGDDVCVHVITVRNGSLMGSRHYFLRAGIEQEAPTLMTQFMAQYYLNHAPNGIPPEMIVDPLPDDVHLLETVLGESAKRQVQIKATVRAERAKWLAMAIDNAAQGLSLHLQKKSALLARFEDLKQQLNLPQLPNRIECFDISHFQGESTVASCVVFDITGALKARYRLYNIKGVTPGDDYGAMEQVLKRRYRDIITDETDVLPDLILIDGGKGQLGVALSALESLGVAGVLVVGVAKGEGRKPGLETLFIMNDDVGVQLPMQSRALHLIQQIRDEAHRFAIQSQRKQLSKSRKASGLEAIAGIGKIRAKALLSRFGSLSAIAEASVVELMKVPGISEQLAQVIQAFFKQRSED